MGPGIASGYQLSSISNIEVIPIATDGQYSALRDRKPRCPGGSLVASRHSANHFDYPVDMKKKNNITRRDFLNGTSVAAGASLLNPWTSAFGTAAASPAYPPQATGLRGSHAGSWETMHARVAGQTWQPGTPEESYDLVVVGGGISGLASAYFYRQSKPDARILILDNHDDVGGHAKRNEFKVGDRTLIAYGGTESIDTPSAYDEASLRLMREIGIETDKFYDYYDQSLYDKLGLGYAVAFDNENFAARKLVKGYGSTPWQQFAAEAPMTAKARADLVRAFTAEVDYLPGMSREQKTELLSRISYREYLRDYVKVDDQVLALYQRWGMSYWCVGWMKSPPLPSCTTATVATCPA